MRRWGRGVATVLAAVALAVTASTAYAAGELELSTDGLTWSSTLPDRIFTAPQTLVPGDVVEGSLWVRNSSADRARVDLAVTPGLGDGSASLVGALELTIDGVPVDGGTRWHGPDLAPGAVARLDLTVTLPAGAGNETRSSTTHVIDTAFLVQTADGPGATPSPTPSATPSPSVTPGPSATPSPTSAPTPSPSTSPTATPAPTSAATPSPAPSPTAPGPGGEDLAHTGSDVGAAFWPALAAVAAGAILVAARRRAERGREE